MQILQKSLLAEFTKAKSYCNSQAVPDKEYTGKVVRIWGTSIKKGGETIIPIEIALDNMDDELLNFNVDVKIVLDPAE